MINGLAEDERENKTSSSKAGLREASEVCGVVVLLVLVLKLILILVVWKR